MTQELTWKHINEHTPVFQHLSLISSGEKDPLGREDVRLATTDCVSDGKANWIIAETGEFVPMFDFPYFLQPVPQREIDNSTFIISEEKTAREQKLEGLLSDLVESVGCVGTWGSASHRAAEAYFKQETAASGKEDVG